MASNFDFLDETLPELAEDARAAERTARTDPRTCLFYCRRAVEHAVDHIYSVRNLDAPYRDDLAAHIHADAFAKVSSSEFVKQCDSLRKLGNNAVHRKAPMSTSLSGKGIATLFHLLRFAAYRFSANPRAVVPGVKFDPDLVPSAADRHQPALSTAELIALNAKLETSDSELKEARKKSATLQREIEELRAQVAESQAKQAAVTSDAALLDNLDEAQTRSLYIDADLLDAGWAGGNLETEVPVTGMPRTADNLQGNGYVDYVLRGTDGRPLALVEAKRASRDPEQGKHQAKLYADALESMHGTRPVIFLSSGVHHKIWDEEGGYPPRDIRGFYTRDQLELLHSRRAQRQPLENQSIPKEIAGRSYQIAALKAVSKRFDERHRRALLVMATGTGKTRVAAALCDMVTKANWAKRVLFLADRRELVRQAFNSFTQNLPHQNCVNLLRTTAATRRREVEGARIVFSTYQTMMGEIESTDEDGRLFGPGFFDLIIIDEAHRSVYAKYGDIFEWFDALLVGLTATPKEEVDRDTYRLFGLEGGVPTYAYPLDQAVEDGFLVPMRGKSIATEFSRGGVRYADLSDEEKAEWDSLDWTEDGETPDEVDKHQINKWLHNDKTVDHVLNVLMSQGLRVEGGDRMGKTIIFACNQRHAEHIRKRFDDAYPQYAGRVGQVITSNVSHSESLIDNFKDSSKTPDIAISVDMLDTGIDVPEVVNLVFFKPVKSASKFWQMVGRGTRKSPDLFGPDKDKECFYVFDVCENFEFFAQYPAGVSGSVRAPLSARIFQHRVALAKGIQGKGHDALRASVVGELATRVASMTEHNFQVRPHRDVVAKYKKKDAWEQLDETTATELVDVVATLPSTYDEMQGPESAKRFDVMSLKLQLALLDSDQVTFARYADTARDIVETLRSQTAIPAVAQVAEFLEQVDSDTWWQDVTVDDLEELRTQVREIVQFLPASQRNAVYADFDDSLIGVIDVDVPLASPGLNMERFREKVRVFLRDNVDHMALVKLRRGKQLTQGDLDEIWRLIVDSGEATDENLENASREVGFGVFVRSLVGLERSAVEEAFAAFLDERVCTSQQVEFCRYAVEELVKNGSMDVGRLFEEPFTSINSGGVEVVFETRANMVIGAVERFNKTAQPMHRTEGEGQAS